MAWNSLTLLAASPATGNDGVPLHCLDHMLSFPVKLREHDVGNPDSSK